MLCEFRTRVVEHGLEQRVLDLLLDALKTEGLVGAGGKQRTDSTHVIGAVRDLNRLELAGESVRAALEAIAVAAPDWLPTVIDIADWGRRYGARVDTWRLPSSKTKRAELAAAYGADAVALLRAVYDTGSPALAGRAARGGGAAPGAGAELCDHHQRRRAGGGQGAGGRHRWSPARQNPAVLAL